MSDDDRGRQADQPSDIPMEGWKDIAVRVKDEIGNDHTTLSAAGVAFYGFLASVPALAALVSIYGLFADPDQIEERVQSLFGTLPQAARDLLTEQLRSVAGASGGALSIGIVVSIAASLWAASGGWATSSRPSTTPTTRRRPGASSSASSSPWP